MHCSGVDETATGSANLWSEVVELGKQVPQAAAESAVETAKQEGHQHGEELSSSKQEKVRRGVSRTGG